MFAVLGRVATRRPWWVVAAWIIAGALVVVLAPSLKTSTDQAKFLPDSYESVQAQDLQKQAFPGGHHGGAVVVFRKADDLPLFPQDHATVARVSAELQALRIRGVQAVVPGTVSPNQVVQLSQVVIPAAGDPEADDTKAAVEGLRKALPAAVAGTGLTAGVAGTAAVSLDESNADEEAARTVALATVAIILALLLLVFRSPVAALLPVVVIAALYPVTRGLIASVNEAFDLTAGTITTELLTVVLFGVGTDYTLFLLFRYREGLRAGAESDAAVRMAVTRVGEAIASAAGVVIVAFAALTLSSLGLLKSLGPALAIAVFVMLAAGLTLIPALVALLGPRVFWPSKAWRKAPTGTRFRRLGEALARHPARWAGGSAAALLLLACGAFAYEADYDLATATTPPDAPSQAAIRDLEQGFPPGVTEPTEAYLTTVDGQPLTPAATEAFRGALRVPGVVFVESPRISADGRTAQYTVIQDQPPSTAPAMDDLRDEIRSAAHRAAPPGTEALVGGATAVSVDTSAAVDHDYKIVFPVAAVCILVILALLLRSLVAPWLLMLAVALGFGATLGASTLVFHEFADQPGLIFVLPIVMYLFVVALGTDYNILMVSRLREESRGGSATGAASASGSTRSPDAASVSGTARSPGTASASGMATAPDGVPTARAGTVTAVAHTGPTIASAGLILTGTFATLLLGGNTTLIQMGFTLAFGIALTAFVMALLLTPALTALAGPGIWWPGRRPAADEAEWSSEQTASGTSVHNRTADGEQRGHT